MPARVRPQPQTPMGRILANTAWLIGGKGFGAVCGLAYLAILTRTLGLKDFGHFSLIFGTALALVEIAGFQAWRVVVRYGSESVHEQDWDRFGRLAMLCAGLEALGALAGCIIAAVLIYGMGPILQLNPAYVDVAFLFSCAMVWALVSTPTGVVRALDRFDLAVYVEAIVPLGRLLAALFIWWTGPSVVRFLIGWAVVDLIETALYWIVAGKLCPRAVRLSLLADWRQAVRENAGFFNFSGVIYAGATLNALVRYGPLMAVGALVNTKAAGLYRLASQIVQAMSKLSALLTRSVYAEVARARVASTPGEFLKLARQTTLIAGLAGAVVVAIAMFAGPQLLTLIAGDQFAKAATVLVPLAIAGSFELASVPFEPVLHSTGNARVSLVARLLAVVVLGVALWLLIGTGPEGAAWAVAISAASSYLALGALSYRALSHIRRTQPPNDQPEVEPSRD